MPTVFETTSTLQNNAFRAADTTLVVDSDVVLYSNVAGNIMNFAGFGSDLILRHGASLIAFEDAAQFGTTSDFLSGSNTVVLNSGSSIFAEADALHLFGGGNSVVNNGEIFAKSQALELQTGQNGGIDTGNSTVENHGLISAGFIGVRAFLNSRILNTGTISTQASDTGTNYAVVLRDGGGQLQNTGEILGKFVAVFAGDPGATTQDFVENSGLISAEFIALQYAGTAGLWLNNSGQFTSVISDVVETTTGVFATNEILNTGTISSTNGIAYRGGAGTDTVTNAGTMVGDVLLGGGNNVFDGRGGTLIGTVQGGAGNDTYITDDSALQIVETSTVGTDEVRASVDFALGAGLENLTLLGAEDIDGAGNAGQNVLTGNAGDNDLSGGGSRDTIDGGLGHDHVDAGRGDDFVRGVEGNDVLMGRAGSDTMNGGEGDDFLFGGVGDDSLIGDDGNDTLKGGGGEDTLVGGGGADTFVYTRVSDSAFGGADDVITDFVAGQDVMDFSALMGGALDFNASGGFTGVGQASVLLSVTGSGNTRVFVDADGDGAADMRVLLQGSTGLTEADFLL